MNKVWGHFKTICTHKKWVAHYCNMAGIPFQGLVHDLSKFSPTEFWESVKYYTGTSSPINGAKADKGYSAAWLHHKGRNKHHYHYWMDNFDKGGENILMPEKYFIEFVCDSLGANRAYNKDNFTYAGEYEWWSREKTNPMMNPQLKTMLEIVFSDLKNLERDVLIDNHGYSKFVKMLKVEREVCDLLGSNYLRKVYRANCNVEH